MLQSAFHRLRASLAGSDARNEPRSRLSLQRLTFPSAPSLFAPRRRRVSIRACKFYIPRNVHCCRLENINIRMSSVKRLKERERERKRGRERAKIHCEAPRRYDLELGDTRNARKSSRTKARACTRASVFFISLHVRSRERRATTSRPRRCLTETNEFLRDGDEAA